MLERFLLDENGATAIEYGLILSVLSLAIVGALGQLASIFGDQFDFMGGVINDSTTR